MRVETYMGDRLTGSRSIAVETLVRRVGCVSAAAIERDRVLVESDLAPDERWLSPALDVPLLMDKVVGQSAKRRIDAGRPVTAADLRAAMSIQRGDTVTVHTLSGGMNIHSMARAMNAAREGEMVELRRDGSKKSFFCASREQRHRGDQSGWRFGGADAPSTTFVPHRGADG